MELNLKLISLPSAFSPAPAPPSAAKATPHGRVAAADDTGTGSSGSATAPSGLTAALAIATIIDGDYDSGDDFHWDGDEFGAEYTPKLTNGALYSPSSSLSVAASLSSMPAAQSSSPSRPPWVSPALLKLLSTLSVSLIKVPLPDGRFAVADMGATDHMLPDKLCFISYRTVSGLSVCMGNNSFVPVLGPGTAVFELNGKRLLVRNVLHVPGLAVPLYSLRKHITQRGCGFIRTEESGFLVYFPKFILSVDTAVNCHLSFALLGRSAPLNTLHYVQPRCPPVVYPSEVTPTLSYATPALFPVLVKDDVSTAPSVAISVPPTTSCVSPPAVVDSSSLLAASLDLSAIST